MTEPNTISRRSLLANGARVIGLVVLSGGVGALATREKTPRQVWQIDPSKCTHCGRCATNCVITPSAVKCVNVYELCVNCEMCGGYLRWPRKNRLSDPNNRRCPTNAIIVTPIEGPYAQYSINTDLCTGCAKCTVGCAGYGSGSMMLQIDRKLCVDCNLCKIATVCPSDAFVRVPETEPYILKIGSHA